MNGRYGLFGIISTLLWAPAIFAAELCIYIGSSGKTVQVNAASEVPPEFRQQSRCFSQRESLAKPQEIILEGNARRDYINSPLGKITIRWPRKIESLFGRTPLRATTDAANTVSRALRRPAFPSKVQNLSLDWQIIFLDADLPETQIPSYLIQNCHPGWMTPPANIYLVAQRIAGQCRPHDPISKTSDKMLTRVLVHEMGHAVEFYLLGTATVGDRTRAEGFATWFEQFASEFSSVLNQREITEELRMKALRSGGGALSTFPVSDTDYAKAAAIFSAIESRLGLRGVIDVYETITRENLSFSEAITRKLGWNSQRINEEIKKYLSRG